MLDRKLKMTNCLKSIFLTSALFFCDPLPAVELIALIDDHAVSLEIGPQDSVIDVLDTLNKYSEDAQYSQGCRWYLEVKEDRIIAKSAKNPDEPPRDYYNSLTSSDQEDIGFILRTLANTSIFKIMSHKAELERAGDRVEHVHPFKFLFCIFSNEELKVCIRNLQGKGWVWKDFLEGITTSLDKENAVDNLKSDYIKDFSKQLKIDPKVITAPIKKKDWKGVVENLIENVPREGDVNRYDQ